MSTYGSHRASGRWADVGRVTFPSTSGTVVVLLALLVPGVAGAQLFDFDSAPIHASLPIDQTIGGITAHLSATGQGFAIQPADQMGFTPVGFGGLCVYPNSISASDLLVSFSVLLTGFSIQYAPQELGCDDSAIMRVTAYLDGVLKGTATTTAPAPGTWPTGTLTYNDPGGFNQVVVHYDQPPACTDHGPIFMADNMAVTAMTSSVPATGAGDPTWVIEPNPFSAETALRLQLARPGPFAVSVQDVAGRHVRTLLRWKVLDAGAWRIPWDGRDDSGGEVRSGVYFCRITSERGVGMAPIVHLR